MNKKVMSIVAAATLSLTTAFGVWAACGDSECAWVGGTFTCVVTTADGKKQGCTADNPCNVSCP